jgi:hypothetical protein
MSDNYLTPNEQYFSYIHCIMARTSYSKGKDWLAQNQNNMSELSEMSTRGLVSVSTMKIQLSMLV